MVLRAAARADRRQPRAGAPRALVLLRVAAAVAAANVAGARVATAQGGDPSIPGTSPLDLSAIQNATLNATLGNLSVGETAAGGRGNGARRTPASAPSADALRFRRDPTVSRRVRAQAAAEVPSIGVLRTAALRTAITGGAVYDQYAQLAARFGARADDAGDAAALYLVGLWLRANDPAREPTAAEVQAVRTQVRAAFGADPGSRLLVDESARQLLGERLAYRLMVAEYTAEPIIKGRDQAALQRLRDGAAEEARRALGVDVRSLALTDRGLVRAGGAPSDARPVEASVATREPAAASARGAGRRETVRSAPAAESAPAGPVDAVVLRFTMVPGVAGGSAASFEPTILYRDGRAVDPDDPRPDGRGRWRREASDVVVVQWESGRNSRWEHIGTGSYFYARPGRPDERVDGTFRSISGGGTSEVTAFSARDLTFRRDGTFALESSGGGFSGSSAASARRASAGRYRIDGWTITFTYPDGRTEKGLFYRYPDSDRVIGVGGPGGVRTYAVQE